MSVYFPNNLRPVVDLSESLHFNEIVDSFSGIIVEDQSLFSFFSKQPLALGLQSIQSNFVGNIVSGRAIIPYNLEQLAHSIQWDGERVTDSLLEFPCHADYSAANVDLFHRGPDHQVFFLPVPPFAMAIGAEKRFEDRPIDIVFVGAWSHRRHLLVNRLRERGLSIVSLTNEFGEERRAILSNSKIGISVRHGAEGILETTRIELLLSHGCLPVVETSVDPVLDGKYDGLARFGRFGALAGMIEEVLGTRQPEEHEAWLRAVQDRGGIERGKSKAILSEIVSSFGETGAISNGRSGKRGKKSPSSPVIFDRASLSRAIESRSPGAMFRYLAQSDRDIGRSIENIIVKTDGLIGSASFMYISYLLVEIARITNGSPEDFRLAILLLRMAGTKKCRDAQVNIAFYIIHNFEPEEADFNETDVRLIWEIVGAQRWWPLALSFILATKFSKRRFPRYLADRILAIATHPSVGIAFQHALLLRISEVDTLFARSLTIELAWRLSCTYRAISGISSLILSAIEIESKDIFDWIDDYSARVAKFGATYQSVALQRAVLSNSWISVQRAFSNWPRGRTPSESVFSLGPPSQSIMFKIGERMAIPPLKAIGRPEEIRDGFYEAYGAGADLRTLWPLEYSQMFDKGFDDVNDTLSFLKRLGFDEERIDDLKPRYDSIELPKCVTILTCYNESDCLRTVIPRLLADGSHVVVIDNWSDDQSYEMLRSFEKDFGIELYRYPFDGPSPTYDWKSLLEFKEEIAAGFNGSWIVHQDMDELRTPVYGGSYREYLKAAQFFGFNAIDHVVLNYWMIDEGFLGLAELDKHFEFFGLTENQGYSLQRKAWLQGPSKVDLSASGGHDVQFSGRRVFPIKAVIHHYPLRSPEQAVKKVFTERKGRFSDAERKRGWHTHYDNIKTKNDIRTRDWKEMFHVSVLKRGFFLETIL